LRKNLLVRQQKTIADSEVASTDFSGRGGARFPAGRACSKKKKLERPCKMGGKGRVGRRGPPETVCCRGKSPQTGGNAPRWPVEWPLGVSHGRLPVLGCSKQQQRREEGKKKEKERKTIKVPFQVGHI